MGDGMGESMVVGFKRGVSGISSGRFVDVVIGPRSGALVCSESGVVNCESDV